MACSETWRLGDGIVIHELAHVISDLGGFNRVRPLVRQIFSAPEVVLFPLRDCGLGTTCKFCVFAV